MSTECIVILGETLFILLLIFFSYMEQRLRAEKEERMRDMIENLLEELLTAVSFKPEEPKTIAAITRANKFLKTGEMPHLR